MSSDGEGDLLRSLNISSVDLGYAGEVMPVGCALKENYPRS